MPGKGCRGAELLPQLRSLSVPTTCKHSNTNSMQAEGGEWKEELLFRVPRGHPEIERLEGRYKK